jgi:tryptophan synthase alpha chain
MSVAIKQTNPIYPTKPINRIVTRFARLKTQGRKALIPFITCGDPSAAHTVQLMHAMAAAGADVIELGVPFSDPMADGPVIQKASERALAAGMNLRGVLAVVAQYRAEGGELPVVLMGYANPIERMGVAVFAKAAQAAGVDGVLVVDYPPEEAVEQAALFKANGLAPIFLLSPTTTDTRIQSVAAVAQGYIYYVSIKGITGAASLDVGAVARKIATIRQHTALPLGVGFGISSPESAAAVGKVADAVVIGSKIIQLMEAAGHDGAVAAVSTFIASVRHAMDAPSA